MKNKTAIAIFFFLSFYAFCLGADFAAAGEKKLCDRVKITLHSPSRPNSKLPKRPDNKPMVVKGIVPVEIKAFLKEEDMRDQRYIVEYFVDGELVCTGEGKAWLLDTTKYKNGTHKLIVNFWDKKGPSAIGIVYLDVENPLSIEKLKEALEHD